MSQIFKKMAASAALLMLPLTSVSAYYDSNACAGCNPCCPPCFNVGVDFLYWKPCVDDLTYAAHFSYSENTDTDCLHYKDICQKWEPGVRVFASMPNCFCNWDAMASFTYIQSCDTAKCCLSDEEFDHGFLISPLVHPFLMTGEFNGIFNKAKADWNTKYFNPDLLFAYHLCQGPCLSISPYFGVAGLYLEQELCFRGFDTFFDEDTFINSVDWKNNAWGVGLKFGCSFEQKCSSCVSVFANGSASLLAGKRNKACNKQQVIMPEYDLGVVNNTISKWKNKPTSVEEDESVDLERKMLNEEFDFFTFKAVDDDSCLFLPGYHIQAGFKYASNMCGCDFALRLGYEFLNWHNVPNPRIFSSEVDDGPSFAQSTSPNTRTFGFHGLFVGLEAGF